MTITTGDIIKHVRKKHGLTQAELGNILGVKISAIQKYESGSIQNLKIDTIRKFCSHFQIPALFVVFPELTNLQQDLDVTINGNAKAYLLNAEGQKKVLSYINDLVEIEKYRR